jgi:hypothetical protein
MGSSFSRKEFLRFTLILSGTAAAAALAGCSSSSSGPSGASCASNGAKDTAISSNHGHALTIPAADFAAGNGGTYHIAGTASHDHTVTLTADQMKQLASGTPVTIQSSLNIPGQDHMHDVTIGCA